MQILFKAVRRNQSGYALTITLTFLLVTLIVFASIMYWVTSSARVTTQNNLFNISQAAAQGATETAIAQMDRDFVSQSLNNSNVYMPAVTNIVQTGWPVKFKFSDPSGNANKIYVSIQPQNWATNFVTDLGSQFTGLYGAAAECDVIAVATPTNAGYNMSATVHQKVKLCAIPVFQYGVFYNMDLDIGNGQAMTMNGKVHCNGTIWMCPQQSMTFNDAVEASIVITNKDNPNDQQNHTFTGSYLHYNGGLPLSGADTLAMPINGAASSASNVEAILNLPPTAIAAPNFAAYDPTNQIYLYNKCDLIISNANSGINGALGTNITIYFQDQTASPYFNLLTNNEICTFSNRSGHSLITVNSNTPPLPATNYIRVASSFPFVTNVAFYDFREKDTVQAVQIDVGKLTAWLANAGLEGNKWNLACGGSDGAHGTKGHPIDSIFVCSSVSGSSVLPAVRVVNGARLPSAKGLTIATPLPIYVLGDYNITTDGVHFSKTLNDTTYTYPAAVMGDAITILSSAWNDSWNSGTGLGSRNATNTTVNVACLEGIVPSIFAGGAKHYSGGLENFLRMLEDWTGDTLTYNGSIVVMFPSIYATNYWQLTTVYYNPPNRQWGFDANFEQQDKLPPCTPQAKAIIRGNWTAGQ